MMPQPGSLQDPQMYLKLAQAAAARGNPQSVPPGSPQPPGPPQNASEKVPPQVIQMFAQGIQQIIPNLQPPQLQAVIQLLSKAFAMEDQLEPPGQ